MIECCSDYRPDLFENKCASKSKASKLESDVCGNKEEERGGALVFALETEDSLASREMWLNKTEWSTWFCANECLMITSDFLCPQKSFLIFLMPL